MKITPRAADIVRTDVTRAADKAGAKTTGGAAAQATPAASAAAQPKADKVQISDAGRALSAQGGQGVSAERMAQIRTKIQEGAYNSLAVVDEVARRILDGGDA